MRWCLARALLRFLVFYPVFLSALATGIAIGLTDAVANKGPSALLGMFMAGLGAVGLTLFTEDLLDEVQEVEVPWLG